MKPLTSGSPVHVKYRDHVGYARLDPLLVSPQVRECLGWLVHDCPEYITIAYDRDAGPPTLKGGDSKASGLLILRSDILELKGLDW